MFKLDLKQDLENRKNCQPYGLSRWFLHSLKRITYSSVRTTELLASSIIQVKSLKVILTRLNPNDEEFIAKEDAGFRAIKKHHRTDFQPQNLVLKVSSTSVETVRCS